MLIRPPSNLHHFLLFPTGQLCSSNEHTRASTIQCILSLARQCSDTNTCLDMLNQLMTLLKGLQFVCLSVCLLVDCTNPHPQVEEERYRLWSIALQS